MATLAPLALTDAVLAAGDQWQIAVTLPEYAAADGWTATLYLRGPSTLDVVGAGTGDVWTFTAVAVDTATRIPGLYAAAVRVVKATDIRTLPAEPVQVSPNIATATPNAFLTHEERCIPLLEAGIEKRVKIDMQAYTITNTAVTREELATMTKLLRDYRSVVDGRLARLSGRMFRTHSVQF